MYLSVPQAAVKESRNIFFYLESVIEIQFYLLHLYLQYSTVRLVEYIYISVLKILIWFATE